MAFYDKFPYTNFQDINLDRIIQQLIEVQEGLDFVIKNASLKYADPIQWSITSQYQTNTVVINPENGTAYISTQPVPVNILITDTDYWTPVFSLQTLFNELEDDIGTLQGYIDEINNTKIPTLQGYIDTINNTEIPSLQSQIDALDAELANASGNYLNGKTVAVFGDSLSNLGQGITNTMWQYVQAAVPSATIYDYAVGGSTITDILSQIQNAELGSTDIIFLNCGTNDWQVSQNLYTFYQTLTNCLDTIRTKTKTAEVILIAMPFSFRSDFSNNGIRNTVNTEISDYCNAITIAGLRYSMPVINLYADGMNTNMTYNSLMDPSGTGVYVHPNQTYAAYIARKIVARDFSQIIYPVERSFVPNTGVTGNTVMKVDMLTGNVTMTGDITCPTEVSGTPVAVGQLPMPAGIQNFAMQGGIRFPVVNYTTSGLCWIFYDGGVLALQGTISTGQVIVTNH